ncbi:hypothetical protein P3T23_009363 [Paraburkholderia sp. GAS448]|uniref:hypothetical protein n=1 Tax=Paraburkholderia sp. GAS448 TaxID=3035136 RepID=UPI003D20B777
MADMKYFCDIGDQVVQLKAPYGMPNKEFEAKFPGIKGLRYDGYTRIAGYPLEGAGGPLPVTRVIEFKAHPSFHECNAKCLNGSHKGTCECRCGGKNHGRGMFTRMVSMV